MKAIVQRVSSASVKVDEAEVGVIGRGLLVLVGVDEGDDETDVATLARKLARLRIFEDGEGRMNLDTQQAGGAMLIVSQFTLAGNLARGNRPSFGRAARPEAAEPLIDNLVMRLRELGYHVETGKFRAHMEVSLVNDGPVTLILEVRQGKVVV